MTWYAVFHKTLHFSNRNENKESFLTKQHGESLNN